MKNIKIKKIILLALAASIVACENQGNDFPEYDYQTVYFPIQCKVKTS
jgi:hypothetical protein